MNDLSGEKRRLDIAVKTVSSSNESTSQVTRDRTLRHMEKDGDTVSG